MATEAELLKLLEESRAKEATLHQINSGKLATALWDDGDIGAIFRQKAKKVIPDLRLPEDEIAPVLAKFESENKKLSEQVGELIAKMTKRDEEENTARVISDMQASVDAAARAYGLTAEGREKMLDRMKTAKSFDAEAAAAWVVSKTPPKMNDTPTWADKAMNLFGTKEKDEKLAKLHRDPDGFRDDEINEFLRDPDRYVAETFGAAA
jgi:hypothetical protein